MEMVWVPAGYWVGKYEVTQTEYKKVMGSNPSAFNVPGKVEGARRPVENVSWDNAMAFCKKLTEIERAAGRLPEGNWQYSLPTEKQWEYFVANADLENAVHSRKSGESTAEVGSKKPNNLGLYDVRGNVSEWCLDPYDVDPTKRVCRGGGGVAGGKYPENIGVGYRHYDLPIMIYTTLGFRCVVVPSSP
jgi:formylglycine-generating enzyme required for sulfatase activity